MANFVRTFLARFELGLLGSFSLCFFVEEYPVSEVDLPKSEPTVVVELGLPLVVLGSELCDKSLFFNIV